MTVCVSFFVSSQCGQSPSFIHLGFCSTCVEHTVAASSVSPIRFFTSISVSQTMHLGWSLNSTVDDVMVLLKCGWFNVCITGEQYECGGGGADVLEKPDTAIHTASLTLPITASALRRQP